jgi:tRNA threonylcarbamoyladenosine biosynthesis protein TsaE
MRIVSKSAAQTKKIAAGLAKKILNTKPSTLNAKVVALVGDLGAGKTTFVQGFAKALGIKHRMVSPTFLIMRRYQVSGIKYHDFYHVDIYRIHDPKELNVLNFKSILHSPLNIVLIEWAEKIKKILPKDTIWVNFTHGRKETERIITY